MISIIPTLPLIIVLWAVAWLAGSSGSRLPKKSWKRLPVAILVIGVSFGVPALQVHLLTTIVSDRFAHDVFFYILVSEYIPAIALVFYAGIREDRMKKRREMAGTQAEDGAAAKAHSEKK